MFRLLVAVVFALFAHAALAVVNLNSATKDELIALPGIGPAKAQAIIDYRSQHGGFKSVEELKDVKGIGAKRFEKLKAELTVGNKTAVAAKPDAKGGQSARGEVRTADAKGHK
ncbi:MAG TPA: helix-hairpin-helix domain-containing protein [Casimicrobiaceae bacterium]|nr:helix-hairpin-helix domain-containing protein [Casimicrobiaceae bacterium]